MTTAKAHRLQAGPALLVRVGLLLLFATAAVGTSADADLWGHLRFGQDILQHKTIVQADQYSFTSDRPWTNHEWLSEVILALAYRFGGTAGLLALKLGVIAGILGMMWRHFSRIGLSADARMGLLALAFVGTYWRTHSLRPQLFSVLLFCALLITIYRADAGRRRLLLVLPLLMALWVNLHGGWIVGLGVLGFWIVVRIFERQPGIERLWLACIGLATAGATVLNPYGIELWRFMMETVRFERADIQEWGSILAHPVLVGIPWALVSVAAGVAAIRGGGPRRLDYLAIVILSAIASFRVSRLDAFFATAVVVLLAPQIARALPARKATSSSAGRPAAGVIVITVVALAAMLVPAIRIVAPYAGCVTIGGSWTPDAEAARFISLNHLRGRMLTWFDWGEYAIWHFGPALKVSMDGRRETVYSSEMIERHRQFYGGDETAEAFLEALSPDYVWVAASLPVSTKLPAMNWRPIFASATSIVFTKSEEGFLQVPREAAVGPRCFPGP